MKYIINSNTLYLLYDGVSTKINDNNKIYNYKGNVINQIIENSCVYYGCTLKGRLEVEKKLIYTRYKLPILISINKPIIIFSIKTNKEDTIYWLNYNNIQEYKKINNGINIVFKNNSRLFLHVSWTNLNNQILKASRLMVIFLDRIDN